MKKKLLLVSMAVLCFATFASADNFVIFQTELPRIRPTSLIGRSSARSLPFWVRRS